MIRWDLIVFFEFIGFLYISSVNNVKDKGVDERVDEVVSSFFGFL